MPNSFTWTSLSPEWINSPRDQLAVWSTRRTGNLIRHSLDIFSIFLVANDQRPTVHKINLLRATPCASCRSVSKWSDVPFLIPLSTCGEQLPRSCCFDCLHQQPDDTSTTPPLETLVDALHQLSDFDDPRNCLQSSRVVVEVRREDGLLSCLWPALNRVLEQSRAITNYH
ncbi:hypothetical protein T11_13184 [Trichinella zimbabwensis]|uniref:Uncharacterized protein n=1 Tax=Trichinella zimbabwensis TaxID=268475 RepID=A0A0V1HLJ9_9BILA|nr:hypothetical protein T11_10785 [Trichinella zimbabwensis]KRZ11303.1 hypothetical protein T11_13184 [Trichinella zimbabwensis]